MHELFELNYGMAISKEGKINMRKVGYRRGIVKCSTSQTALDDEHPTIDAGIVCIDAKHLPYGQRGAALLLFLEAIFRLS